MQMPPHYTTGEADAYRQGWHDAVIATAREMTRGLLGRGEERQNIAPESSLEQQNARAGAPERSYVAPMPAGECWLAEATREVNDGR